jgi:hypothetical protein
MKKYLFFLNNIFMLLGITGYSQDNPNRSDGAAWLSQSLRVLCVNPSRPSREKIMQKRGGEVNISWRKIECLLSVFIRQ